ncbi:MAG: ABC transporter ATP-binding protein [Halodesulfurarchaeum sp.]
MSRTDEGTLLSINELKTYYEDGGLLSGDPVQAVDGVSFDIDHGETVGLVGESGCGKTTLGRTILQLESATDGSVEAYGEDVTTLSGAELKEWQRNAQMVFQDPDSSLNDRMTVGEIVREPLDAHDWPTLTARVDDDPSRDVTGAVEPAPDRAAPRNIDIRLSIDGGEVTADVRDRLPLTDNDIEVELLDSGAVRVELQVSRGDLRRAHVRGLLETVGLRDEHYYRYPHQFSGGQKQRVGIARALALEPEFVVLDEPVSALDVSVQARIINLLEDLQAELDLTYLFIAHDLSVVRHIADRVAVMYLGNLVELGPTEDVFQNPQHPYTISLLSAIPGSDTAYSGTRVTLRGTPPSPRDPPSGCPFATRCPAKVRPDDWDLPEPVWEAIGDFRTVLRERARGDESLSKTLKRRLGIGEVETVDETLTDLFGDRDVPDQARKIIDEAAEHARTGDHREGAQLLRDEFGSVCDDSLPDTHESEGSLSRCVRHQAGEGYDSPESVIERRTAGD